MGDQSILSVYMHAQGSEGAVPLLQINISLYEKKFIHMRELVSDRVAGMYQTLGSFSSMDGSGVGLYICIFSY